MGHLIKIREKEVENTKKQISQNDKAISKLNQRLKDLEKSGNGPEGVTDWENKYR